MRQAFGFSVTAERQLEIGLAIEKCGERGRTEVSGAGAAFAYNNVHAVGSFEPAFREACT
jgi:hypothetical protein